MKTVNATWELRNLGKRTIELTLEKADFVRDPKDIYAAIGEAMKKYKSEYTVVKVKPGKPQIAWELQRNGFLHIETQLHLKAERDDMAYEVNKYQHIFGEDEISVQPVVNEKDVRCIQEEIRKGIFTTDRVALDPYFGVEIANRRYANWVGDEVGRGATLTYIIRGREKVGFGLGRNGQGLLGGLFTKYQKDGSGGEYEYAGCSAAIKTDRECFYTTVSSNNPKILRLHEMFGYRVRSLYEVYVRHEA